MLGQRRRRWPNIETTLGECLVFAGKCGLSLHVTIVNSQNYKDHSAHEISSDIFWPELSRDPVSTVMALSYGIYFPPLEVLSRYRDPHFQMGKITCMYI